MNKEAMLGLFVVAVLVVFLFFTVNMGTRFFAQGDRTFHFYFENIGTLEMGAPVKQKGVDVGEVSGIDIVTIADPAPEKLIEVQVKVNDEASISVDSRAFIQTMGMMGEKYLDISFGQEQPATKETKLEGISQYELDRVIQNVVGLTEQLTVTVQGLNKIFGDPELPSNINKLVDNLGSISENVNNLVGGATGSIMTIMNNLEVASADLKSTIATAELFIVDTQKLVKRNERNIDSTIENTAVITSSIRNELMPDAINVVREMKGFSGKLEDSIGRANNMIAKLETLVEENREDVHATISDIRLMSNNFKQASIRVNDMLNREEGLVHDIFYDTEFSKSTKNTVKQTSKTLETVNSIPDRITFETELRYFSDDNRFGNDDNNFRGDLGVQFDITDKLFLFAGGNNLGVENDLEARLGYRLGHFSFYGGMIESEAAAGAAWYPIDRLTFGLEGVGLTDSGEERLDLYSHYRIWQEVYLTGGVQDVTNKVFPNAGVMVRF